MESNLTLQLPSGPLLQTSWLPVASSSTLDEEIKLVRQYLCHISQRRNRVSSPLLRLPAELQFAIMEELFDFSGGRSRLPQRDLQNCSLVCSALLPYARARLLLYLHLNVPNDFLNAVRMFRDILPELHTQPRVVYLIDKQEETEYWKLRRRPDTQWGELRSCIVHMLQRLTLVTQLHIQLADYAADQPALLFSASGQLTVPTWSHIAHLTLERCRLDDMHTLLNLVLQFPSLAALEMLYCSIANHTLPHDHGPHSQKLALHRLQVVRSGELVLVGNTEILPAEECIRVLSKYMLPDSLHELECDLPRTVKGSLALRDAVACFGASLQDIHLHWDPSIEEALLRYSHLIATLSAHAPNVRSVTQTLRRDNSAVLVDWIVGTLEHTHLENINSISTLIPGSFETRFHITCPDIARIARTTRSRVRIALYDHVRLMFSTVPDENWQQRYRETSSVLRHVEGRSFLVAQDLYEFEGEGYGRVLVRLERTEADNGSMQMFHALEVVRCDHA